MNANRWFLTLAFVAVLTVTANEDELAKESIAKCKATAGDKPTAELVVQKVNDACKLVEAEGEKAFAKFKGKDSDFLFCGTYIWIHDLDGVMLVHPVKHKLQGKTLLHLRDGNGKLIFVSFNDKVKAEGAGWVDYLWPKPGEKKPSKKVSYVKMAEHGGKKYVVGCGVYDIKVSDVSK